MIYILRDMRSYRYHFYAKNERLLSLNNHPLTLTEMAEIEPIFVYQENRIVDVLYYKSQIQYPKKEKNYNPAYSMFFVFGDGYSTDLNVDFTNWFQSKVSITNTEESWLKTLYKIILTIYKNHKPFFNKVVKSKIENISNHFIIFNTHDTDKSRILYSLLYDNKSALKNNMKYFLKIYTSKYQDTLHYFDKFVILFENLCIDYIFRDNIGYACDLRYKFMENMERVFPDKHDVIQNIKNDILIKKLVG